MGGHPRGNGCAQAPPGRTEPRWRRGVYTPDPLGVGIARGPLGFQVPTARREASGCRTHNLTAWERTPSSVGQVRACGTSVLTPTLAGLTALSTDNGGVGHIRCRTSNLLAGNGTQRAVAVHFLGRGYAGTFLAGTVSRGEEPWSHTTFFPTDPWESWGDLNLGLPSTDMGSVRHLMPSRTTLLAGNGHCLLSDRLGRAAPRCSPQPWTGRRRLVPTWGACGI